MTGGSRLDLSSGGAPAPRQETEREEIARRQAQAELAAAARRAEQASLEQAGAEARERLQRVDAEIEGLLSRDPQDFVIRFLQTGGQ
jgi:molecular chaperone GrpE (heat shock protein)